MKSRLIDQVAKGVAWSTAEKVCSMLLQMVVSIVVARLLVPEDFGVMAILTFFTAVALVVVDSGFSQTLLRKESPSNDDYKSVFLFNLAVSVLLYLLFVAVAPLLAGYYNLAVIAKIAPVLFLLLPLNALGIIQNTKLSREFRFGVLSRINFIASLVAGVAAIAIALCGGGVWALVAQRLSVVAVKSLLLWWRGDWRGEGKFNGSAWRAMAPFSFRLMSTDIVSAIYNNVAQLFIGKIYSADTLGYFNQAQKIKDLPVQSAVLSVQTVTYPALAKIKGDGEKFAESFRKVLLINIFVMAPLVVGMSAVAQPLFEVLLGERWLPTVPYFEVIALAGVFYPLAMVTYNVLKVHSNGAIIFRLELLKKAIMTAVLALTIPHSTMAIAYGLVAMTFVEFVVNFAATRRYTALSWWQMTKTLAPSLLLTAVMYLAVKAVGYYVIAFAPIGLLLTQIAVGVVVYAAGAWLCRMEAFKEFVGVVKGVLKR
ncbi:MAG: lipopolysaccharide biosynthesis protein [Alistipes sp.]|nr:lipopolysaccharide biosynthesis protein [Alistipes sp.]